MSAKKQTTEPAAMPNVENVEKTVVETVYTPPNITSEMAEMLLSGNFDHIRRHFGIGAWTKAKTKENKLALLKRYKALVDSMNYMGEYL